MFRRLFRSLLAGASASLDLTWRKWVFGHSVPPLTGFYTFEIDAITDSTLEIFIPNRIAMMSGALPLACSL
jgi:hypothetical protein